MKLSHSKMALLLKDPMSYYVKYHLGISAIETKPALSLGSAVHWGLEHSTSCLDDYYNTPNNFTDEQGLAEAMVSAYLKHKNDIFDLILAKKDGTKLKLLNETHEQFINSPLQSFMYPDIKHQFIGVADLLLDTDEGIVLIDYKTSSQQPDWNEYLDQIYRYIFMLKNVYPDKPVRKIGIVNIRKSGKRQKTNESTETYYARLKAEYEENADAYIYVHMYEPEDLDKALIDEYVKNLSRMADACETIERNKLFYINFGAQSDYGKAEYYDIFYKTPNAYTLYSITDTIIDDAGKVKLEKDGGRRPCIQLDLDSIEDRSVLDKYEMFKAEAIKFVEATNSFDKQSLFAELKKHYKTDDSLLDLYWNILNIQLASV